MRFFRRRSHSHALAFLALASFPASQAHGWFLDGTGHYALRGETETNPGFNKAHGTYQAIEQFFRLEGEVKASDTMSFNLEMTLFDNPRAAYLGDTAEPKECAPRETDSGLPLTTCEDRYQDPMEPGYRPYSPRITQAHAVYSSPYCLLDVGRRSREWGLGAVLSSARDKFDTTASVFDGITCNVNTQKTKTLGFSFGYDKLAETGTATYNPYDDPSISAEEDKETYYDAYKRKRARANYGPGNSGDDMDQFFLTIDFDDRKANSGAFFTKNIGIYAANVTNRATSTDMKIFDLYTGLFLGDLAFQNELIFRVGRSSAPSWVRLGGKRGGYDRDGNVSLASNNLQAAGFAGGLEYSAGRSGSLLGPKEYNQGDFQRHVALFEWAYAPGDSDGYFDASAGLDETRRDRKVTSMAFHRNFKPAMILFNLRPYLDSTRVDGAFDPGHFVNATLFALGYRYENMKNGNVQVKGVMAQLNQTMPKDVRRHYDSKNTRPVGYAGNSLGYELDLNYTYKVGSHLELGIGAAAALPGDAWNTEKGQAPSADYLIQSAAAFTF
jgi:hypothetical protein